MKTTRIPKVLLVEDAPDLALLYHVYLRDEPIDLQHVTSGAAALAKIEAAPPDVLILDLSLPDMDGGEVLAHVAKANLSTRVLVITAYGNIDIAVQAMRTGLLTK